MNNPKTSNGYVYVMTNNSGNCKVGHSIEPKARLSQLKCADQSIELKFISGMISNRVDVESACHEILNDRAVGGEWFSVSEREAVDLVEGMTLKIGEQASPDDHTLFNDSLITSQMLIVGFTAKGESSTKFGNEIICHYLNAISGHDHKRARDRFLSLCDAEKYIIACGAFAKVAIGFEEE